MLTIRLNLESRCSIIWSGMLESADFNSIGVPSNVKIEANNKTESASRPLASLKMDWITPTTAAELLMFVLYNFGHGILAVDFSNSDMEQVTSYMSQVLSNEEYSVYLNESESHVYYAIKNVKDEHPVYIRMRSNPIYESLKAYANENHLMELLV